MSPENQPQRNIVKPLTDAPEDGILHESVETNSYGRTRRIIGGLLLAGSVTAFAFEQSPLNEAIRANEALEVIKEGGNEIDAGLKVFGITMAIELGSSALIVAGLNQKGGVMNEKVTESRLRKQSRAEARAERKQLKKLAKKGGVTEVDTSGGNVEQTALEITAADDETESVSKLKKAVGSTIEYTGVSLGLGAGIVVIDENMKTSEPSLKKDVSNAVASSTLISGVSGVIAYLGTGGIRHLEGTKFEGAAEKFVDYATDIRFWMLVLSPIMLTRFGRWASDIRRERREAEQSGISAEYGVQLK